ncbi:hypothetical protein Glove_33g268 [Diversispora epigaea]|uniref:Uncharacterized protein n=1 Tax=Diversispora epigaea TaxID=1348612 RepID=A0A397JH51_9GLOM|nr:hypothetical protein Glove_33g268 [Diversispora epigaea]
MKNFENSNQLHGDPLISAISKIQHFSTKKDGSLEINEKITKELDVTSSNDLITLAQTITTNGELKFFDPPCGKLKKEESGNHNISNEEFENEIEDSDEKEDLDDDLDEMGYLQLLETLAQDFNSNWWPLVSNVWTWFNLKKKANGDSSQTYTWHLIKHNQSSTQRRESQVINSENSFILCFAKIKVLSFAEEEYEIMTREYWIKHDEIVSSLFIKNSPQEPEQLQQLLKQSRHLTTHQPQIQ